MVFCSEQGPSILQCPKFARGFNGPEGGYGSCLAMDFTRFKIAFPQIGHGCILDPGRTRH